MPLARQYGHHPGRPLVWIDDSAPYVKRWFVRTSLVVTTDSWFDLTSDQMHEICAFIVFHRVS